jgi:hypothetical protein
MSEVMTLPPDNDPRWQSVATGKIKREWSNLAMKILMTRISRLTASDSSPACAKQCAGEIHAFFQKNSRIAQDDLAAILR